MIIVSATNAGFLRQSKLIANVCVLETMGNSAMLCQSTMRGVPSVSIYARHAIVKKHCKTVICEHSLI
jgi:hypothetical protein